MKSKQAQAAAAIKKHLQSQGLKVKAKSDSFSMGDSVNIEVLTPDLLPNRRKEIVSYCDQYQYGHFNGMEDIYEYSNKNTSHAAITFSRAFNTGDNISAITMAHARPD